MQDKDKQTPKVAEQKSEVASIAVQQAAEYEVKDLADNCKNVFGANITSESVLAAFQSKGIHATTVTDAKKIVNDFLRKEIN